MIDIWKRVSKTDTCWNWIGHINENGYGRIYWNGKKEYGHRVMYRLFVGEIPKGLVLDHLCRNTRCVNPKHLEAVTQLENIRRGYGCRNGEENHQSKLKVKDILKIRKLRLQGYKLTDLGVIYGVHPTTIGEITRREIWRHIP